MGSKLNIALFFKFLGVGVNVYYILVIILIESLAMNFYLLVVFLVNTDNFFYILFPPKILICEIF